MLCQRVNIWWDPIPVQFVGTEQVAYNEPVAIQPPTKYRMT